MGEALITRRGGGFDITELRIKDLTYKAANGNARDFTIPSSVDLATIKGFFVCLANTTEKMDGALYSSEGKLLDFCGSSAFTWKDLQIVDRTVTVPSVDSSARSFKAMCFY